LFLLNSVRVKTNSSDISFYHSLILMVISNFITFDLNYDHQDKLSLKLNLKLHICGSKIPTRCNRLLLLQILLLAQHVSGTIMPIIKSSRVLYSWVLPVVFGALVFKLSVWCGAEGYVSGLRDTYPSAPHHIDNLKTKHQRPQAATNCIILSSS
jgi:hypothetical protein